MNKEALEFYLESKNLLSQKIEEKLAEEKEGDTYSKLSLISAAHQEKQANFKENAIKFVKAHPKATENAIVGGLMGGGSELAMPSQYDMTGQPATNMSRIGKRALLGAAMGGVGGEIKSNVRGHISKLAASKEAGAWDTVKTFSKNTPFTVGLGVGDALIGANAGYVHKSKKDRNRSTSKRVLDTVSGGLVGLGMGMLHGGILDHLGRPLHNPAAGHLPYDLLTAIRDAYSPAGLHITTQAVREAESAEYGACRLALDDRTVVFRVAKTTPTKVGQFVTLWKRPSPDAEIAPLDSSDGVSLVVVSVGDATFRGQFVFPQKTLLEKGIMSRSHKGGKRAFRVYPPWSKPVVPEAVHTQKWQMRYFLPLPLEGDAGPIPKTDKSPKGTLVQFPPPEKLAGMLSPMLQRAGGMIAKNPRAASAVLGAGAGLASNELTGADAPVFSAVAGGALGALGGKQLLRATVNRAKPLLGKDVASGAVNVMKQNRASQLALKPPTSVNMGATQQAAAKMRPVANTQVARTLPVGKGSTNYNTTASSLPSQTKFNPTQVASNKPQTNLPGVSFHEGPVASPTMPQKQDPMAGYRPSRSTIPQLAPQRGSMAKSTFDPSLAQTMSKLAHIMKW